MLPVFVGERSGIENEAEKLAWDISQFRIVDAEGEQGAVESAAELARHGEVDALLKGQVHSDIYMRTLMRSASGLRTDQRCVHVFHMSAPEGGRPLLISDGAFNVQPDMDTKKASLRNVVKLLHALNADNPKIAILSATETPISSVPSSMEAQELELWAKREFPNIQVRGPLAMDLILSKQSARDKGMSDDPVAGEADGVIVPDLVSGNVLFKSLVYLRSACAAGVVMGAKVPILLTSRADPPAARLASMALASILSGTGHNTS